MATIIVQCVSCGRNFSISDGEQAFFNSRNLVLPKRCRECRQANRVLSSERNSHNNHPNRNNNTNRNPADNPRRNNGSNRNSTQRHKFITVGGISVDLYQVVSASIGRRITRGGFEVYFLLIRLRNGNRLSGMEDIDSDNIQPQVSYLTNELNKLNS